MNSSWTVVGEIRHVQTFAEGHGIRELHRLLETYGEKHWRKRKGFARIRLQPSGIEADAELH